MWVRWEDFVIESLANFFFPLAHLYLNRLFLNKLWEVLKCMSHLMLCEKKVPQFEWLTASKVNSLTHTACPWWTGRSSAGFPCIPRSRQMEKPLSGTLSHSRGKEMAEHTLVPTMTLVTTAHTSLAKAMYSSYAWVNSSGSQKNLPPRRNAKGRELQGGTANTLNTVWLPTLEREDQRVTNCCSREDGFTIEFSCFPDSTARHFWPP